MSAGGAPAGQYRPCVGIALFNRQGLVFIGRRANKALREHSMPGHEWQMPQGGIDAGEAPRAAALRELREETGVASASLLGEAPGWSPMICQPTFRSRPGRAATGARRKNGSPFALKATIARLTFCIRKTA